jgi:O-antigen/teichoic acid export membrane protein
MKPILREIEMLRASILVRNTGWMVAGQGCGVLLQAVYFVLLARLLGASEYGVFAGAYAFTGLVAQYGSLGSGTLLLQYVSINRSAFAVYWGNILISVFVVSGGLIAALCCLAPQLLNSSSAGLVVFAAFSNCLFAPLTEQTARIFQCFEKMHVTMALNLLTNLMRALVALWMFCTLHHATAWQWAFASTIVSAVATAISVGAVCVCFGSPRFVPRLFIRHGLEGLGYSFASSTTSIYNDVDKTMLSHYGMNAANGVYSMAYRVVDIATIPIYSIREAVLPRLFRHGRDGIRNACDLSYRLLRRALPFSFLVGCCMFVAAPLIPRIAGSEFAESVMVLRWLCLIPVLRSVHILLGSVLTGAGMQSYRTAGQLTAAGINFGLNLWAIPHYGWLGAAWTSLIADGTLCVLTWGILHRFALKKCEPERRYA